MRERDRGVGLGIAGGIEKDARVATAVELRVGEDRVPALTRMVTAFDCGRIVNPDALRNQVEGAISMGLGGALFEAVHFERGGVLLNASMTDYRVPRVTDLPAIEVVLLDQPDLPSAGAGETPIMVVAPAIANAIFDATGVRLRDLPLIPDGRLPA
jgi:isoquinoline 1-oxidoreductase